MRKMMLMSVLFAISCASPKKEGRTHLKDARHPLSALEVFQKYGCKNCHVYPGLKDYTDYGKEAMSKGYGCVSLLTKVKSHSASLEARQWFKKNRCSECHDIDGRGVGRQNLTAFGVKMEEQNLGCVGVFKDLRGE